MKTKYTIKNLEKNISFTDCNTTMKVKGRTDDRKSGMRESFIASVAFFIKACSKQNVLKELFTTISI